MKPIVHDAIIKEVEPCANNLSVRGAYLMCFRHCDDGPLWMKREQQKTKNNDTCDGEMKSTLKNRDVLIEELLANGIVTTGDSKQVKELVKINYMPLSKGMLQMFQERGYVDEKNHKQCALKVKKDDFGNITPETSLAQLESIQKDLIEEKKMLQQSSEKLGAIVDRAPKYHPELAGEGMEHLR